MNLNKLKVPDPGKQLFLMLLITTLVATSMVVLRTRITGNLTYVFMLWNLFLAWIPYLISTYMKHSNTISRKWYINSLLLFSWLLFFPNAPYILTDLVHLKPRNDIGYWYDLLLLLFFCFNSLFLAFASLVQMKRIFDFFIAKWLSHIFVLFILMLSSFGVYLGRIERYNSWDIITDPVNLYKDIFSLVVNAKNNIQVLYMVFFLSLFLIINYFTLLLLHHDMHPTERSTETKNKNDEII